MTIDKANYFAFKIDDIEEAHSHVNFSQLASDRAGYRLKDNFDQDVLGYLSGFAQASNNAVASSANSTVNGTKAVSTAGSDELLTSMKLKKGDFGNITTSSAFGDHSIPLAPRLGGATAQATATATPLQVIARMGRLLDTQFVDTDGRWLVLHPTFIEVLKDEDSRLLNGDFGESGGLRSRFIKLVRYMALTCICQITYLQWVQVRELQVLRTKTQTMVLSLQDTVQQ